MIDGALFVIQGYPDFLGVKDVRDSLFLEYIITYNNGNSKSNKKC